MFEEIKLSEEGVTRLIKASWNPVQLQHWTDFSEKKPAYPEWYLVTTESGRVELEYWDGGSFATSEEECIAWMDRPNPYIKPREDVMRDDLRERKFSTGDFLSDL